MPTFLRLSNDHVHMTPLCLFLHDTGGEHNT